MEDGETMSDRGGRRFNKGRSSETAVRLFSIGQSVRMKSRNGLSLKSAELYRITGFLPARDNSLQYRIRNDDESHERVAPEDNLEAVGAVARTASGDVLVTDRIFPAEE